MIDYALHGRVNNDRLSTTEKTKQRSTKHYTED